MIRPHPLPLWLVVLVTAAGLASCSQSQDGDSSGGSTSFQAAILEDDFVSRAELDRAVQAYGACMEELGLDVRIEFLEVDRVYSYYFTGQPEPKAIVEGVGGVACHAEYLSEVELAWADQIYDPGADAAFYTEVAECMRAKGFEVQSIEPDELTRWIDAEPEAYDDCFDTAAGL